MPLGLAFLIVSISLIKNKKGPIIISFATLGALSTGIISNLLWVFIENPWRKINLKEIPKSDLIVVLSGGLNSSPAKDFKNREWNDPDRFFAGVNIFKEYSSSTLVFTGGYNPYFNQISTEGEVYRKKAITMGVPKSSIEVTPKVLNTYEESLQIKKLIEKKLKIDNHKIILITSAFHMNRAKFIFESQGLNIYPYPVDFRQRKINQTKFFKNPNNYFPNANSLNMSSKALREIIGRIVYYLKIKFL